MSGKPNKKILLVDDDKICNFITEATLNRLGIASEIHAVLNGKEALEIINNFQSKDQVLPDAILLDLNMPIMNGFQFLEAFRELKISLKKEIMIIILTSSENPEDIVKAKKFGITHFLTKPLNEKTILTLLAN